MASVPDSTERSQQARPDKSGNSAFTWDTTHTKVKDIVKLIMPPMQSLPIVFVPGIMGSNLCSDDGKLVWVLNSTAGQPLGLALKWALKSPGERQKILHPDRTKLYRRGAVPKRICGSLQNQTDFESRGWGEVSEASYHQFLLWLEKKLNGEGFDPARWEDFSHDSVGAIPSHSSLSSVSKLNPGTSMRMDGLPAFAEERHMPEPIGSDDLLKRAKFRFPVYASGYNWLQSNDTAAEALRQRICEIISENNRGLFKCTQVILVTHSMGGLVARACAQLPGMESKIAGIVHGVMPTVGTPVAYRRCKIGMWDENKGASSVIGTDGPSVTAVFAQSPGALQLLPSREYGTNWLQILDERGGVVQRLPEVDPYTEIYLEKDRWWGLVREDWLSPVGGKAIVWEKFEMNIKRASVFHNRVAGKYHPNTFVFYGAGEGEQASFEKITWTMNRGSIPKRGVAPTSAQTVNFTHKEVREDGSKIYIGGERKFSFDRNGGGFGDSVIEDPIIDTSFWEMICRKQDGRGDGTVSASSGMFPRAAGGKNICEQFRLTGISHEPAFQDRTAQQVTLYAITKIAFRAKTS